MRREMKKKKVSPNTARSMRKGEAVGEWEKYSDAGQRWLAAGVEVKFLICLRTSACCQVV